MGNDRASDADRTIERVFASLRGPTSAAERIKARHTIGSMAFDLFPYDFVERATLWKPDLEPFDRNEQERELWTLQMLASLGLADRAGYEADVKEVQRLERQSAKDRYIRRSSSGRQVA